MSYAKYTKVPIDRSAAEIERVIQKRKPTGFARATTDQYAVISFEMNKRRIMFRLPMSDKISEQQRRSRWRGLLLCIKAKFESIESGIETFEDAFLAQIQMPDGRTVSEHARPAIADAYAGQPMRPLLSGPSDK